MRKEKLMRKYKFSPKTGLLVAGLIVGAYAEACYNNPPSQAVCYFAGATVDAISWNGGAQDVTATQDWTDGDLYYGGKGLLHAHVTATSGYLAATDDSLLYCYGPAKFIDGAGNTDTVSYWENNVAGGGDLPPYNGPANDANATWGALDTNTTCP
jgi:hypothetical protein